MVGAIADWFAVTALFKHPLGLPIPHTALIPKRKDELGKGLEEFVGENFLQEEIIRDRVAGGDDLAAARGAGSASRSNARRVVDEVADVASIGLARVQDEHIAELVESVLVPRFREEPIAPLLGTFLVEVVRDDLHHGVVDLALEELHRWLVENPETVHRGARRAGAVVGADPAQRGGDRTDPPRGGALGRGHPRRPAPPRPRGAGLDARPARPGPAVRPRDPGPRRAAQGAAARPPAVRHAPASRSGTRCAGPCSPRSRDPTGPVRRAAASRSSSPSPTG